MQIRDAAEADLPAITAILNEAILNGTAVWSIAPTTEAARADWLRDRRGRGFPVFVAEDRGRIAGFGSYGDFRPWDGYRHTVEHSVYVEPSHRGRGVGAALLAALVERARADGKHVMVGGIEAGNAASLRLHDRAGFERVGRLREVGRKFDRWLDLVFVQRLLASG
jgi:L-amino acid N-acyltransferase YncA